MTSAPNARPTITVGSPPPPLPVGGDVLVGALGFPVLPNAQPVTLDSSKDGFRYFKPLDETGWMHIVVPNGRRFVGARWALKTGETREGSYASILSIAPDGQLIFRRNCEISWSVLASQMEVSLSQHQTIFAGMLEKTKKGQGTPYRWQDPDQQMKAWINDTLLMLEGHPPIDAVCEAAVEAANTYQANMQLPPIELHPKDEMDESAAVGISASGAQTADVHSVAQVSSPEAPPAVVAAQPSVVTAPVAPAAPPVVSQPPGVATPPGVAQPPVAAQAPAVAAPPGVAQVSSPQVGVVATPPGVAAPGPIQTPAVAQAPVVETPPAPQATAAALNGHNPAAPSPYPTSSSDLPEWMRANNVNAEHLLVGMTMAFGDLSNSSMSLEDLNSGQVSIVAQHALNHAKQEAGRAAF